MDAPLVWHDLDPNHGVLELDEAIPEARAAPRGDGTREPAWEATDKRVLLARFAGAHVIGVFVARRIIVDEEEVE